MFGLPCKCVCERERERERESVCVCARVHRCLLWDECESTAQQHTPRLYMLILTLMHAHTHTHTHTCTHTQTNMHAHPRMPSLNNTGAHAYTLSHIHTHTHAHTLLSSSIQTSGYLSLIEMSSDSLRTKHQHSHTDTTLKCLHCATNAADVDAEVSLIGS